MYSPSPGLWAKGITPYSCTEMSWKRALSQGDENEKRLEVSFPMPEIWQNGDLGRSRIAFWNSSEQLWGLRGHPMLEPWGSALDLWPNFSIIAERRKVELMELRTRRRCHTRYSKWMNSVWVGLGPSPPPLQCLSSPTLYFWKYPEQDTSPQANSHSDDLNEILTEHLCAFFFFFLLGSTQRNLKSSYFPFKWCHKSTADSRTYWLQDGSNLRNGSCHFLSHVPDHQRKLLLREGQ